MLRFSHRARRQASTVGVHDAGSLLVVEAACSDGTHDDALGIASTSTDSTQWRRENRGEVMWERCSTVSA
jgi:hypothetical protein